MFRILALLFSVVLAAPAQAAGFADKGYIEHKWTENSTLAIRIAPTPSGFALGATVSKFLFLQPGWAEITWFNLDGTLNQTIGKNGIVSIPLKGQALIQKILTSPTGGYFVLGAMRAGMTEDFDLIVLRLRDDGTLDTSYGKNGTTRIDLDFGSEDFASDVVIQRDGSLYGLVTTVEQNIPHSALVKLAPNGTIDPFFADSGLLEIPAPKGVNPLRLFRDSNGLTTMFFAPGGTTNRAFALRMSDDGKLDQSFGTNGISELGFPAGVPSAVQEVAERTGGGYWLIGAAGEPGKGDFLAVRLDSNGRTDGFAGTGYVKIQPPAGATNCGIVALGETGRGELTALGQCAINQKPVLILAQWAADGSLDQSFGKNGVSSYEPPSRLNPPYAMVKVADGWLVHGSGSMLGSTSAMVLKFDDKGNLMAPNAGGPKP